MEREGDWTRINKWPSADLAMAAEVKGEPNHVRIHFDGVWLVVTSANHSIAPALATPNGFRMPGNTGIVPRTRSADCSTMSKLISPQMFKPLS